MNTLAKILKRKDQAKIIQSPGNNQDEEKINHFLEELQKEKGRVKSIQCIPINDSEYDDGTYSGAKGYFNSTYINYFVYYRCHKKID